MRRLLVLALATAVPATAIAQPAPPARVDYAITLDAVADNCKGKGLALTATTAQVTRKGDSVKLGIAGLPTLAGSAGRRGKLRVEATMDGGAVSASGRANASKLSLVLIVEHKQGDQPTCTQSFSVQGKAK